MSLQKLAAILILVITASGLTIFAGYNLASLTELAQTPFRYVLLAIVVITAAWRFYMMRNKSGD